MTRMVHPAQIRLAFLVVALGSFLVVSGCGSAKSTISGKVTYNGKTLGSGTVSFFGGKDGKELLGTAQIDSEGLYNAKVNTGPVTISVETIEPPKPPPDIPKPKDAPEPPPPLAGAAKPGRYVAIPAKFKDPNQSGLKFDVKSGPNKFAIEMKD